MNTKRFIVRDREAGVWIESFNSLLEAIKCIEQFETEDKVNGIYEFDFYEVYDSELEEIVY